MDKYTWFFCRYLKIVFAMMVVFVFIEFLGFLGTDLFLSHRHQKNMIEHLWDSVWFPLAFFCYSTMCFIYYDISFSIESKLILFTWLIANCVIDSNFVNLIEKQEFYLKKWIFITSISSIYFSRYFHSSSSYSCRIDRQFFRMCHRFYNIC